MLIMFIRSSLRRCRDEVTTTQRTMQLLFSSRDGLSKCYEQCVSVCNVYVQTTLLKTDVDVVVVVVTMRTAAQQLL